MGWVLFGDLVREKGRVRSLDIFTLLINLGMGNMEFGCIIGWGLHSDQSYSNEWSSISILILNEDNRLKTEFRLTRGVCRAEVCPAPYSEFNLSLQGIMFHRQVQRDVLRRLSIPKLVL